ncbi:MAG: hypothetical protein CM15mP120_22830 [Pseudomonadota bacterium]|nr:MAG: hypothetical protein CM15mP120_22830 [Pseudomonadota bacterium]
MQTLDTLRSKAAQDSVFVLANVQGGKVGVVVAVSKALSDRLAAPELINAIGPLVGAKGVVAQIWLGLVGAIIQQVLNN